MPCQSPPAGFAFGHRRALERYFVGRLALLQEEHWCWLGAERSCCLVSLRERLRVITTAVRFVRVRSSLAVPAVDEAVVLGNTSAMRSWMSTHVR